MTPESAVRRLVFVHTMPDGDLPPGTVVALTGHAYVACADRGLEPTVIDDHVDRRRLLLSDRLEGLRWQIGWFKALSRIGTASPSALQTCRHLLHGPLDVVIANARLLDAVVHRLEPTELVYAGPHGTRSDPWHQGHLYFSTPLGDEPISATLLRSIGVNRALRFTHIDVGPPIVAASAGRPHRISLLRTKVRRRAGTAWNLLRARRRRRGPSSLLLWTMGYGAGEFARSEGSRGYRVLGLRRNEASTCVLDPERAWVRRRGPLISTEVRQAAASGPLALDPLLLRIDRRSGVAGTGEALRSRIEAYCSRICPTVETIASGLASTLEELQVERVAAASPWAVEEFGALLACASLDPIPHRTLVQHGDAAFPYDCWILRDLPNFDELACTDPTVPSSLAPTVAALGEALPSFSLSAHRIEGFERRARRSTRRRREGRRTVCYVPTGFQGENNQLCGAGFDDAWYARWQLQLLDAMVARPDLQFIWKAAPVGLQVDPDPLRERIPPAGFEHIRYTSVPFRAVVGNVDRVFTDFASTALFEAVQVGVPTLCVSFTSNEDLRVEAVERLTPCLRAVPDEAAALRLFDQFLDDDAARWTLSDSSGGRP